MIDSIEDEKDDDPYDFTPPPGPSPREVRRRWVEEGNVGAFLDLIHGKAWSLFSIHEQLRNLQRACEVKAMKDPAGFSGDMFARVVAFNAFLVLRSQLLVEERMVGRGEPVVLSIARKGPERQRYAMAEAAQGRDPMARPVAGVWPMDTRDFAKVPGRLGRALGAVDGCIAVLPALLEHQRPSGDEVAAMRRHSTRIVECSEQLLRIVEGRGAAEAPRLEPDVPARESAPEVVVDKGPIGKSGTFAQVSGRLDAAQYFVEKTARDVARMPTGLRPTPERASQIRGQLMALIGRAGRLIEVIGAGRPRR